MSRIEGKFKGLRAILLSWDVQQVQSWKLKLRQVSNAAIAISPREGERVRQLELRKGSAFAGCPTFSYHDYTNVKKKTCNKL